MTANKLISILRRKFIQIIAREEISLKAIIDKEDMLLKRLLQLKYHSSWKARSPENF